MWPLTVTITSRDHITLRDHITWSHHVITSRDHIMWFTWHLHDTSIIYLIGERGTRCIRCGFWGQRIQWTYCRYCINIPWNLTFMWLGHFNISTTHDEGTFMSLRRVFVSSNLLNTLLTLYGYYVIIIIIIIIIWFGVTITVTHLTKCNTKSKVRAMSAKQTNHTLSCRGLSTWHSFIHMPESASMAAV